MMKYYAWLIMILLLGCSKSSPTVPALEMGFQDNFDRQDLGTDYSKYGGSWHIHDGALRSLGERNIPLWLNRGLPPDVKVEMDVWSNTPAVDIKIEIFGDGKKHESGYIVIFGGWKNKITAIARLDEHEKKRKEKRTKWKKSQKYHWVIERQGNELRFFVDGKKIVTYDDPYPLSGPGHDRLAFTNWESEVYYDNLKITPL